MPKLDILLKLLFTMAVICLVTSCVPRKQIVYFLAEDSSNTPMLKAAEPIIEANDRVRILVNSLDKEATSFFVFSANDNSSSSPGYLVNSDGNISIPLIGKIHIAGLTPNQTQDTVKMLLEKYINRPT